MQIKKIRHQCIAVSDMKRSLDFYATRGLTKMVRNRIEEGEYIDNSFGLVGARAWVVYLEAPDGSLLELIQLLSHPNLKYNHVSYTVEGLEGAKESPYNKVKAKFVCDPDGNLMECVEELICPG